MSQITITLSDEQLKRVQDEFGLFSRLVMKTDPGFRPPSFDAFINAKILDNLAPLTEAAVADLLAKGEYGWAQRSFEKGVPDLFQVMIEDAAQFGFFIVGAARWTPEDLSKNAQAWVKHVVEKGGGKPEMITPLTLQIVETAHKFVDLEKDQQSPAWLVANRVHELLQSTRRALDTARGSDARDRLGQLRVLMRLATVYGSLSRDDEKGVLDSLRLLRPELFSDEPDDIFSHLAAFLRRVFLPDSGRQRPRTSEPM
jgi:hypothetical protein